MTHLVPHPIQFGNTPIFFIHVTRYSALDGYIWHLEALPSGVHEVLKHHTYFCGLFKCMVFVIFVYNSMSITIWCIYKMFQYNTSANDQKTRDFVQHKAKSPSCPSVKPFSIKLWHLISVEWNVWRACERIMFFILYYRWQVVFIKRKQIDIKRKTTPKCK